MPLEEYAATAIHYILPFYIYCYWLYVTPFIIEPPLLIFFHYATLLIAITLTLLINICLRHYVYLPLLALAILPHLEPLFFMPERPLLVAIRCRHIIADYAYYY